MEKDLKNANEYFVACVKCLYIYIPILTKNKGNKNRDKPTRSSSDIQ